MKSCLFTNVLRSCTRSSVRWKTEMKKKVEESTEVVSCQCAVECDKKQPRVVIIGAGMAGLTAAARLSQCGLNNYIILEATQRPGGRILSCWIGDTIAELGAHWRPRNCTHHPIFDIGLNENPPRPGVPAVEYHRGLLEKLDEKLIFSLTIHAYYKFRQIEKEAHSVYCHGGSKQQGSLINFMSLRIQQELHEIPVEHQPDAARIMFGLAHMLCSRSGGDTSLLVSNRKGYFMHMPGGEVSVPLGLFALLAPLLRTIPKNNIAFCQAVNCIWWGACPSSGCRAVVHTCDGSQYPADYVIITVSLGVLHRCMDSLFCPQLPCSKVEAIRNLYYGHCNKIYVEYCRPFYYWQRTSLSMDFSKNPDLVADRKDWTRGITEIEIVPHSKYVLCVWVVGPAAVTLECLSDRDVAEGITDLLRNVTGDDCIPYPTTVLRSNWSSNPYFLGAYSQSACKDPGGSAQMALSRPLPGAAQVPFPPILLFAGEATVPGHNATIAGARLSGVREAERIISATPRAAMPTPLPCPSPYSKFLEQPCKEC